MGTLRNAVGSRLPHRWTNRLRRVVRSLDQLAGLPLSPLRPGAVALYHVGRCGSSVLGDMLDRHSAVRWDREIYFHRRTEDPDAPPGFDSAAFLRRRMWAAGRRWYGFEAKILPQQDLALLDMDLPALVAEVESCGVTHHVVLERRNALRRLISAAAGVRTGRRHAAAEDGDDDGEPTDGRVRLPVDGFRLARRSQPLDLVGCLDTITSSYATLREALASRNTLHLTFEEDVAAEGPRRAYERVCGFLGIRPEPAEPHTRRMHGRGIRELLENADEVAAAVRATPHAWMLDD